MNFSNLIDLYLEGELSDVEKNLLFNELARNPALREEFEQQLKFNFAYKKDLAQIQVPTDSTNYIFSALNFKIPNSISVKTTPISFFAEKFKYFTVRFAPLLFSSVIGSLLTFLLLWWLFPAKIVETSSSSISYPTTEIGVPLGTAYPTLPEQSRNQNDNSNLNNIKNWDVLFEKALENVLKKNQQESNNLTESELKPKEEFIIETTQSKFTTNLSPSLNNNTGNIINPNESITTFSDPFTQNFMKQLNTSTNLKDYLKNITLSFRGHNLKSDPEVKLNLEEKSLLNNTSVAIGYNLSQNSNLAFEFGQEKFPQKFKLNVYGDNLYYKQNPLLWWYGIAYQLSILKIFRWENFQPYARIFAGATTVGPLFRGSIGFKYSPDNRINLFIGWEGSYLLYKVQNVHYNTRKSGLMYGVTIQY
ncbi:MAG: hypothetical protein N2517_02735 [Ignavibacteria bacterium]|nr:hypothetical protein [Ignavibacteria bacterium]